MTFRRGANRTDEPSHDQRLNTSAADDEAVDRETQPETDITVEQHREWQRWIVETFLDANYGVVPVDHLVEAVSDREPAAIDESTIRTGLTETVLPTLAADDILDYDAENDVVINYGE